MPPKKFNKGQPKKPKQQPAPPSVNVSQVYDKIKSAIAEEDYVTVVRLSDKLLVADKKDIVALKIKVTALIYDDNHRAALDTIVSLPKSVQSNFLYEKTYCLYKCNEFSEALEVLKELEKDIGSDDNEEQQSPEMSRKRYDVLNLKGQLYYRMERYEECIQIYHKLIDIVDEDSLDQVDLLTNLQAAQSSLRFAKASPAVEEESFDQIDFEGSDTYEQIYNYGCILLAKGHIEEAKTVLEKARAVCVETYTIDDEPTTGNPELERELFPILLQLAYTHQLLNNFPEAFELYQTILQTQGVHVFHSVTASDAKLHRNKNQHNDDVNKIVALNNLLGLIMSYPEVVGFEAADTPPTLKQRKDGKGVVVHDAVKKMKLVQKWMSGSAGKLSSWQVMILKLNEGISALWSNQIDQARKIRDSLIADYPDSDMGYLFSFAVKIKENAVKGSSPLKSNPALEAAVAELKAKVQSSPTSISLQLVLIQGLLHLGDIKSAVSTLQELIHRITPTHQAPLPGLISLQIYLQLATQDSGAAVETVSNAVKTMQSQPSPSIAALSALCDVATELRFANGKNEQLQRSVSDYEYIVKMDPKNVSAVSGLVAVLSYTDPDLADMYKNKFLPKMDEQELNIESVELGEGVLTRRKQKPKETDQATKKLKPRRKRKPRLPKNYDPNTLPDPERWLPKFMRKGYKPPKARRQKEKKMGSHQGGAIDDSDKPEFEGIGGTRSANIGISVGSKGGEGEGSASAPQKKTGPVSQNKKKKKKGNKW
ncbi:hypothetical protein BKA69DRAFT_1052882 [Paraphysoderma sedebokerense]|nr:hypothetical protein BKA69DRAFT_1052882 [Paraphysoderma sedebokerense]